MPFGILLADLILSDSLLRGQSTLFAIGRKSKFHSFEASISGQKITQLSNF